VPEPATTAEEWIVRLATPPELDAEPEHRRLRQEDPVPEVRLAPGGEAYLVTRYDDVKRVLLDPVFSRAEATKPGVPVLRPGRQAPSLMLSMDAPEHTRIRKLVVSAFTRRAGERMRPRVQEIVDGRLDRHPAATLLRRLPNLRLAVPETAVEWKTGLITRAPVTLPVTW